MFTLLRYLKEQALGALEFRTCMEPFQQGVGQQLKAV
jgi:hypothetical protein